MRHRPAFFDEIRQEARLRWNQLEADPELAAPWLQLFRQSQTPRHVLSELLQNADDAKATEAKARVDGDIFTFEHNGEDFNEASLRSLCRFGYSNKRNLQTIGFRGLGFKSVFSYGPRVEVRTPTLALAFDRRRFIEPVWLDDVPDIPYTAIRVRIESREVRRFIENDLERWRTSPIPLLFFRHLTSVVFQREQITKKDRGDGPVENGRWIELIGRQTHVALHVVSPEEPFPDDAVEEIRSERDTPDFDLPPARVELVMGVEGDPRLYSILPTEVRPPLPFSCNAPFIQDPARTGIKDPVSSPTNRWLLSRIGTMAAETYLAWLANGKLSLAERANAYRLLPEPDFLGASLNVESARAVLDSFRQGIAGRPCLLTHAGKLATRTTCLALPPGLLGVWEPEVALRIFGWGVPHILADDVSEGNRRQLVHWSLLSGTSADAIFERLAKQPLPPRPPSLERVAQLWAFLQVNQHFPYVAYRKLGETALVPVKGSDQLYPVSAVVVLPRTAMNLEAVEWSLLERWARVVDPAWIEYVRETGGQEAVRNLLSSLGLDKETALQRVFDDASNQLSHRADPGDDGMSLALLAAHMDLRIPPSFRYLCTDGRWRPASEQLLAAMTSDVDALLPPGWARSRVLSDVYEAQLNGPRLVAWRRWSVSDRSRLWPFPPPTVQEKILHSRVQAEQFLNQQAGTVTGEFRWRRTHFRVVDYDFSPELWRHWRYLASSDPKVWPQVVKAIADFWPRLTGEQPSMDEGVIHEVRTGFNDSRPWGAFTPSWLHQLEALPCLPDVFSKCYLPAQLLWKSRDTEPWLRIEPLLHDDFSRPEYAHFMQRLGVRDRPDNADMLVNRLLNLAKLAEPPIEGLVSMYRTLDQVASRLSSDQLDALRVTFQQERLILDDEGGWQGADNIYQLNDDDIPGAPIIHRAAAGLTLWDRLNIPRRPTIELALAWIGKLSKDQKVQPGDLKRVKLLLHREPYRVVEECAAWLDLGGYWTPISSLRYTCRTFPRDLHVFQSIRRTCADVSMIDADLYVGRPFLSVPLLEDQVETRVSRTQGAGSRMPSEWIATLAAALQRVRISPLGSALSDWAEANRAAAQRLAQTQLVSVEVLEVMPFLASEPAGPAITARVSWHETTIYVRGTSASYHRDLVETIMTRFTGEKIRDAIRDCVARTPSFIEDYFAEHFDLDAPSEMGAEPSATRGGAKKQDEARLDPQFTADTREAFGTADHREGASAQEAHASKPPEPDSARARGENQDPTPPGDGIGRGPFRDDAGSRHSSSGPRRPNNGSAEPRAGVGSEHNGHGAGHRPRTNQQLLLLDAVARELGCTWDSERDAYEGSDGAVIRPEVGLFPWSHYDSRGRLIVRIWIATTSLREGVEIPGEVWQAMEADRDGIWLVAPDPSGDASAYLWADIARAVRDNRVELFASSLRLRDVEQFSSEKRKAYV